MSNNLYSEAIDAAEQIKYTAESKVKQQIIEAMSPHIKQLVENQLMDINEDSNEPEISDADVQDNDDNNDSDNGNSEDNKDSESFVIDDLSEDSRNVISRLMTQNVKKEALKSKLEEVRASARALQKAIIIAESKELSSKFKERFVASYKNLLSELANIKSNVILKKDRNLLNEFIQLSKEIENMSTRQSKKGGHLVESLENLLEINLFEDDDTEEVPVDVPDTGDDDDAMSSDQGDIDPDMTLLDLAKLAGITEEDMEPEADEAEEAEEDMEAEADEAEEGEEGEEGESVEDEDMLELPVDMEEMEEEEANEAHAYEIDETLEEGLNSNKELFLEIDEDMLKREISNMKRLREGDASDMASHFGGGDLEDEMFVDFDDVNKLDKLKTEAAKAVRINRTLKSKLSQYKKALRGMKGQLTEMNLFNAKLLYANKLMQNKDITLKQQRNIVESLDEAKTLSEAKLLFESLAKSLSSSSRSSSKNLSEGSLRSSKIGSSSRPTKSSQKLNENVALDRWATLAGIKK